MKTKILVILLIVLSINFAYSITSVGTAVDEDSNDVTVAVHAEDGTYAIKTAGSYWVQSTIDTKFDLDSFVYHCVFRQDNTSNPDGNIYVDYYDGANWITECSHTSWALPDSDYWYNCSFNVAHLNSSGDSIVRCKVNLTGAETPSIGYNLLNAEVNYTPNVTYSSKTPTSGIRYYDNMEFAIESDTAMQSCKFDINSINNTGTLSNANHTCKYDLTYSEHIYNLTYLVTGYYTLIGASEDNLSQIDVDYRGCGLINKSETLGHDVLSTMGTCFEFNQSTLTLNCSNYAITKLIGASAVGIKTSSYNALKIYQCSPDNFTSGIYANGMTDNLTIQYCSPFSNTYGIQLSTTSNSIISYNSPHNNTKGILVEATSNYLELLNNNVYYNTNGLEISDSNKIYVNDSNFYNNSVYGVYVTSNAYDILLYRDNASFNQKGFGLYQYTTVDLHDSITHDNTNYGVWFSSGSYSKIVNHISSKDGTGIGLNTNNHISIDDSQINNANQRAIELVNEQYAKVNTTNLTNNQYGLRLDSNDLYNDFANMNILNTSYESIYVSTSSYNNFSFIEAYSTQPTVLETIQLSGGADNNQFYFVTAHGEGNAIYISNSDKNLFKNCEVYDTTYGFLLNDANDNIINTSVSHDNTYGIFISDSYNTILDNSGFVDNGYGVQGSLGIYNLTISNSGISGNTIDGLQYLTNALFGIIAHMDIINSHFYNNGGVDINFGITGGYPQDIHIVNTTLDSDSGFYENYTTINVNDSLDPLSLENYALSWYDANIVGTPPNTVQFNNKFIDINTAGSATIDYIEFTWLPSEVGIADENNLQIWDYTSGIWNQDNSTPDTVNHVLSITNLVHPSGQYGVVESTSGCGIINTPGVYNLPGNLYGSGQNDAPDLTGRSCVRIESSNVVLDCNGYGIYNNDLSGNRGIAIYNPSGTYITNVTIRNCTVQNYLTDDITLYKTQNSTLQYNTFINDTEANYAINLAGNAYFNNITNNEFYNLSGSGIRSASNTNIVSNYFYVIWGQAIQAVGGYSNTYNNILESCNENIRCTSCGYNLIYNNTMNNSATGVVSVLSLNNMIYDNKMDGMIYGLYDYYSINDTYWGNGVINANIGAYAYYTQGADFTDETYAGISDVAFYNNMSNATTIRNSTIMGAVNYALVFETNASVGIGNPRMFNVSRVGLYDSIDPSYTVIDIYDQATTPGIWGMEWASGQPGIGPGLTTFRNKTINLKTLSGSTSPDSFSMRWTDGELSGYNESSFQLWQYNSGSWIHVIGAGLYTTENRMEYMFPVMDIVDTFYELFNYGAIPTPIGDSVYFMSPPTPTGGSTSSTYPIQLEVYSTNNSMTNAIIEVNGINKTCSAFDMGNHHCWLNLTYAETLSGTSYHIKAWGEVGGFWISNDTRNFTYMGCGNIVTPGYYYLTDNMDIYNGTCLTVNSSNVNISSPGIELSGSCTNMFGSCTSGFGVFVNNSNNVSLDGLSVHSFMNGGFFILNSEVFFAGLNPIGNDGYGLYLDGSDFIQNDVDPFFMVGYGDGVYAKDSNIELNSGAIIPVIAPYTIMELDNSIFESDTLMIGAAYADFGGPGGYVPSIYYNNSPIHINATGRDVIINNSNMYTDLYISSMITPIPVLTGNNLMVAIDTIQLPEFAQPAYIMFNMTYLPGFPYPNATLYAYKYNGFTQNRTTVMTSGSIIGTPLPVGSIFGISYPTIYYIQVANFSSYTFGYNVTPPIPPTPTHKNIFQADPRDTVAEIVGEVSTAIPIEIKNNLCGGGMILGGLLLLLYYGAIVGGKKNVQY